MRYLDLQRGAFFITRWEGREYTRSDLAKRIGCAVDFLL